MPQLLLKPARTALIHNSQWRLQLAAPPTRSTTFSPISRRALSIKQLDEQRNGRERIVILGSGWAGYSMSRDLDARKYQVVVVSPRSYFVFTPLLASTAVGTLEFRTALEPARSFKGRGVGAEYFQAWVEKVDLDNKTLTVEEAVQDPFQSRALAASKADLEGAYKAKGQLFELSWDKLVVAVGCYVQTFNTKGVKEHAYFLKDVGDARRIRNRLLTIFETAALPTTSEEIRKQILSFAIVGGGPTGVEFAAELHDTVYEDMRRLYPELFKYFRITIYDVAPKVLSMFDEKLGQYAMKHFKRAKIDIRTSHHVEELRIGSPDSPSPSPASQSASNKHPLVYTLQVKEDGPVGVGMCVWSTGLMMNPFVAHALDGKISRDKRTGGILTNTRMEILSSPSPSTSSSLSSLPSPIKNVFALGDCASISEHPYPATAQVASQKAKWLAKRLNRGDLQTREFRYKDLGVMAYLGDRHALVQSKGGNLSGWVAWVIWRGAYLAKSVSWRNRLLIPVYWGVNWVFGRDVSRF
jgi:NADH dehydrogenase